MILYVMETQIQLVTYVLLKAKRQIVAWRGAWRQMRDAKRQTIRESKRTVQYTIICAGRIMMTKMCVDLIRYERTQ